jgi:DNA-directed RNA polymerase subunit M/transcription elongation factor TFIIS
MKEDFCAVCNSTLTLTLTPNSIHYGKLDCPKCGFKGFARNPNNPRNSGTKLLRIGNTLTVEKIMKFHVLSYPFCFMCLRKTEELGIRESLTADHIEELRTTKEENLDRVENGQILCTACHKMKLWLTTYLNSHIKGKYELEKKDGTNSTET